MSRQLLRARAVLPIVRPALDDGAVLIEGARIVAVGRWSDLRNEPAVVTDCGDAVLLPGLINAHCHLDYTDMAGRLPPPRQFTDWIAGIVAFKAAWSFSEFARSWTRGAAMLLRTGTTTVADIEAVPELLPEAWSATPLRVHSFLELLDVRGRMPVDELVAEAARRIESLPTGRHCAGLSPHAPYTASPALLRATAGCARERGWRVTTHVAESAAEFEMFTHGSGGMFDWLRGQRDMSDCGTGSPIAHLARVGLLGPEFLAVHVNHLAPGDAALLGEAGASVAHCPRSHAYFRHAPFPRREFEAAGVNICLGTDSLATVAVPARGEVELNLFTEMQTLLDADMSLQPSDLLRLATVNGARALGRTGELGELTPGAQADLIAVPLGNESPETAVVRHQGGVLRSWIAGELVFSAESRSA